MSETVIWTPYCGIAPEPGELFSRWNWDPALLALLGLAFAASLLKGNTDRNGSRDAIVATALLTVLFISPFCALASALFSARAAHHLVLTAVVAPLLASAWSAPQRPRAHGDVAIWTVLHAIIFWFWHAPEAYAWALSNDAAYWLMQGSLLGSAFALWRAIRFAPLPSAIGALLATMVQMGLLGALLTFISTPLYAPHALAPYRWGLTPLEDQQLAGLIMWVPGGTLYLIAALVILARWFENERAAPRAT